MNYLRSRLIKLQAWLKDQEIEAYLITTPANLTYLTGAYPVNQHEREAYLLVTPKAAHLLISPLRAVDPRLVKHLTVHTISPQYNLNQFIQEAHLRYRDIVVEVNNLIYSEAKLLEEQKELFYVCPKRCVRLNFDQGMDYEFHCPEIKKYRAAPASIYSRIRSGSA